MTSSEESKAALRKRYLAKRKAIIEERRIEAGQKIMEALPPLLPEGNVLSFASFGSEIDLWPLNNLLIKEKRLLLPKVASKSTIQVYRIKEITHDLAPSDLGPLEPINTLCEPCFAEEICCVLVPGIVFDDEGYRLGYGKGFYDRLLANLPQKTPTYGIAFREQESPTPLPQTSRDVAVLRVHYF
ncbi:5-formyltetrahydrofolate cyclo-ligase [Simkania negevensis]|uniref:5-formyltetrahydrofolate cyclo-ligase n=1 Tax=Simkania negevensis TaxID=83561 RepID=A0ABS3ASY4_9BACT|nr:5-formyltetrahydrofolate cyclo-ligase [Simkania negevensis]